MGLIAVHPGAYYHIESLEGPRYAGLFDRLIRPEALLDLALSPNDILLVPCRTPAERMLPHAARLLAHLSRGGTIVAMGESHSEAWLPGFGFHGQPTNYWWWLDKDGDLGVQITSPDHPMFDHLAPEALSWHLHGWFTPAPGTEVIATNAEGGPILIDDRATTAGRMILTTLDPFYHHGSHFMPATTRFLDGFLPWLRSLAR
ncbi:MAG: hypothetical protein ACK5IB_05320 [Qingshengfaniella sp.]